MPEFAASIPLCKDLPMCQLFQELDIQSRAAESIVGDWQGPLVKVAGAPDSAMDVTLVRSVWTINELISLLLQGAGLARRVPEICADLKKQNVDGGDSAKVVATARGFVGSIQRLSKAVRIALSILDMFKSQGLSIERASELEECQLALAKISDEVGRISEDMEWEELNRRALPLAEFKELAAYLTETGKASA
jgi:hypothetical protein